MDLLGFPLEVFFLSLEEAEGGSFFFGCSFFLVEVGADGPEVAKPELPCPVEPLGSPEPPSFLEPLGTTEPPCPVEPLGTPSDPLGT